MDDASVEPTVIPLSILREITNGFAEERKLGSGSFGKVYEGVYQDGEKIAVKMLHDMPGLDQQQFQNEFNHLARLRHKNIVRLLGYCHDIQQVQVQHEGKLVLAEKTHRALCLEYMSNGSLEKFLSDECERYDWDTCYKIIKGICQGLKYLHNDLIHPIYHLDLKPANVLLDENMVPRIADFGISRLFIDEQTWATSSSLGTHGYAPPEFVRNNLISSKFDIFSLGVVIIKMMAGRAGYYSIVDMSSQEFINLVQEKWNNRLLGTSNWRNANSEQVKICIQIGLSCVLEDRHKRPSIREIVYRLDESETKCNAAARKNRLSIFQMQQPQAASLPNDVYEPSSSRAISEGLPETGGSSAVVKLRFVDADRPEDTVFTHCTVKWQNGKNAMVAIFQNEKQIMGGDLSKLQIEILPVYADFFTERGHEDFTQEEFNKQINLYKGKESVLTTVNLRDGQADLGSIIFTESSHRKELRLAARVKRRDLTVRVQEAITHPFVVKDRRSELNAKSKLPSKGDAVHTLKGISKNGKHFTALKEKNITTVKHLMRQYHKDKSSLQKLTGMKEKSWSTMIEHARTCAPGDEIYSYRVAEENCEVLFNDLYDLVGIIINGLYVPVRNIDKDQQRKVKSWKISAHEKFDEQENSGSLAPDYFMSNDDLPVRAKPLNNEAGPSVQARPTWQYSLYMAAQQEFGEKHPFQQENGFSPAEVLSNNEAGPSNQEAPLFTQHTAHQDLRQNGTPMPHNGTPSCRMAQGNISNGQGSLLAQTTIPSYPLVQEDDLNITAQSSSITDAPCTSFPVPDGFSLRTSSLNDIQADDSSWIHHLEEWLATEAHGADQLGIVTSNNAELPNSSNPFDDFEHDGGIQ